MTLDEILEALYHLNIKDLRKVKDACDDQIYEIRDNELDSIITHEYE